MKNWKLVLVALTMTAFSSTGCIFVDDDDDQPPPDPTAAVFHGTWSITDAAGPSDCETHGVDKTSFLFTGTDNLGHDELFDCADFAGDTAPLAYDQYTYVVSLLDCPDATPGCPGGAMVGELSQPQDVTASVSTCDAVSGLNCIVDLPTFNFNL